MSNDIARLSAGSAIPRNVRPQTSFERAKRHSRRVRRLKLAIPAMVLLLVALFAGWAWLSSIMGIALDVRETSISDGRIVMASPTLNGFTRDNLPFYLSAAQASQDMTATGRIRLEEISARVPVDPQNWVEVVAGSGVFDSENNSLDIDSPMKVTTSHGLVSEFRSAHFDISDGTIISDDPVRIEMNGSTLTAARMHVQERGKVIILEGEVRMTIVGGLEGWGKKDAD